MLTHVQVGFLIFFITAFITLILELSSRRWLMYVGVRKTGPVAVIGPFVSFRKNGLLYKGLIRFIVPTIINIALGVALLKPMLVETNRTLAQITVFKSILTEMSFVLTILLTCILISCLINIFLLLFDEVNRLRSVGISIDEWWLWRGVWLPLLMAFLSADRKEQKMMCYGFFLPIFSCCFAGIGSVALLFIMYYPQ